MSEPIKKISIIVSQGSLEGVYPALIMANGARMDGIEASLFFTFFGLDAIHAKRMKKLKVATVGNPAMALPGGLPFPSIVGVLPGISAMATMMMKNGMEKLDIPPVDEFIEMISDAGGSIYACKMAMDMFKYKEEDLCDQVEGVITVGEFYTKSAGAQIIFT